MKKHLPETHRGRYLATLVFSMACGAVITTVLNLLLDSTKNFYLIVVVSAFIVGWIITAIAYPWIVKGKETHGT